MKVRLSAVWLGIFLFAGQLSQLLAISEQELLDTWVVRLPTESWQNGQYRYRLLSFWKRETQIFYIDFSVYPSSGVRSTLISGTAALDGKQLLLHVQQQSRLVNGGKGFPTPFRVEVVAAELEDFAAIPSISLSKRQLQWEQQTFTSYPHLLQQAQRKNDALLAADLLMLNFYLLHNQLSYFGTIKMTKYRGFKHEGLIDGFVLLDFEKRGLLGLGNSGVNFEYVAFEPLNQIKLYGKVFGGATKMEGVLNMALAGAKVLSVDFSHVKVKSGYAAEGYYLVNLPNSAAQQVPVGRYGQ